MFSNKLFKSTSTYTPVHTNEVTFNSQQEVEVILKDSDWLTQISALCYTAPTGLACLKQSSEVDLWGFVQMEIDPQCMIFYFFLSNVVELILFRRTLLHVDKAKVPMAIKKTIECYQVELTTLQYGSYFRKFYNFSISEMFKNDIRRSTEIQEASRKEAACKLQVASQANASNC